MSEKVLQWNHSSYVRSKDSDAVVVKCSYIGDDGKPHPHLEIVENPKRKFWITKPGCRNHEFKKEYCDISELDEYSVYHKDLTREIATKLNGYVPRYTPSLKKICNSPYVYGADIDIGVLIKRAMVNKFGDRDFIPFTTGFLDIETSVVTGTNGKIILITVTHETQVYTAILDSFFYKCIESKEHGKVKVKATIDEARHIAETALKEHIDEYGFKLNFFVGETEIELIEWIFSKIHEHKTDFIGIWNLDFDIPIIMNSIEKSGNFPEDVMCHPDLPPKYRLARYVHDKRQTDHITMKWHWLHLTGYTQFLDSMALYSRLRKVKGYEASYALNAILQKELKLKKLSLGAEGSHYIMQTERFLDYIAYNIFDAMSLQIMEWKNTDITSMSILSGISTLDQFAKQTVVVTNSLFDYCLKNGKVTAAAGTQMQTDFTKLITNVGGTVLQPERSKGVGMNCIIERPDFETMLHMFVSDVDFSAYYPNTQCAANISKETKLSTAIQIEGFTRKATQMFYSEAISPKENSVKICHQFFGLPNYKEIDELFAGGIANLP